LAYRCGLRVTLISLILIGIVFVQAFKISAVQAVANDFSVAVSPTSRTILQGESTDFSVSLFIYGNPVRTGKVQLTVTGLPAGASGSFSPFYAVHSKMLSENTTERFYVTTTASVTPGTFNVQAKGWNGTDTRYAALTLAIIRGDFNVSITPSSQSIAARASVNYTVTVKSRNGFELPVNLTVSGLPSGSTFTLTSNPVTPPQNGTVTPILTVGTQATTPGGTFTLTITGDCKGLKRSATATLVITVATDFILAASPESLTVLPGRYATTTVTVTSINNFNSVVVLTMSSLPSGVEPAFNPAQSTPPKNGSFASILIVTVGLSAPVGTHRLTVIGSGGGITHLVNITLITVDFSISASPTTLTIAQGESKTTTVSVLSINNFNSAVTLSISNWPSGLTPSFNPTDVIPPAGQSATSILTIAVAKNAPLGTYGLTITGTSGSLVRTFVVTVTVQGLCLIATATYGSELSPEVQLLRGFRDRVVMSTFSGSQFMKVFNAWYYSFSPYLAEFISKNSILRSVTRAVLYPLFGILHLTAIVYSAFSFAPELGMVVSGAFASALIGLVYFAPLAMCLVLPSKRLRKRLMRIERKAIALPWIASLSSVSMALLIASPLGMMISTAALVLASIVAVSMILLKKTAGAIDLRDLRSR